MPEVPDLLTVAEAAKVLRIGRTTSYRLVQLFLRTGGREGIPAVRVGGQIRVPRDQLERMISNRVEGTLATARPAAAPYDMKVGHRKRQPQAQRASGSRGQLPFPLG